MTNVSAFRVLGSAVSVLVAFRDGGKLDENTLFWWAQWFLGPLDSSGSWQQTQTQWFECADTQTPPEGFGQSGIQRRARMLTQNEKGADGQTKKHLSEWSRVGLLYSNEDRAT